MKLLGIVDTTVTSLYMIGNSQGKRNLLKAASSLVERYQFKKVPNLDELLSNKQTFQLGMFDGDQIDSLEIYPDGVVVKSACNSAVLEAFLTDLDEFARMELGFERIETHNAGLMFASELVVELDPNVFHAIEQYSYISLLIGKMLKSQSSRTYPKFSPAGFMFAPSEPEIAGIKPIPFRLERRLGTDFEKNLFFSSAPLTTQNHLEVLKSIETTL